MPIGCKVTLRKTRMYEFLDRLITIALPRVRDFRGLNPKSFDGRGNYAMGIKEHIMFPEINYDKVDEIWGMDIIVCTTAQDRRGSARAAEAHSISRSGSETRKPLKRGNQERYMAKTSSIEKNNRRKRLAKQYRRPARAAEGDRARQDAADGRALRGDAQAGRAAAQFVGDPHPQPLRDDGRPRAYLPQAQDVSRIALRELGSKGLIPGLVKSSW